MNLVVVYDGKLNSKLDEKIRNALEKIGCKEWASGYNYVENKRDITFDYFGKENNEIQS